MQFSASVLSDTTWCTPTIFDFAKRFEQENTEYTIQISTQGFVTDGESVRESECNEEWTPSMPSFSLNALYHARFNHVTPFLSSRDLLRVLVI
jgi:hypothetical protein